MSKIILLIITIFITHIAAAAPVSEISHDNTKPIEITADSLEVLQEENKAIFQGKVEAKQGDVDIRSEKMTVFYKTGGKQEKKSANKISKVLIDNNIFISTPKETAQGNHGVYDVDGGHITLEGDVTLTSQKNIVKGQKLVYNLKTGQSKMLSADALDKNGKKQRVRGVFVPGGN